MIIYRDYEIIYLLGYGERKGIKVKSENIKKCIEDFCKKTGINIDDIIKVNEIIN